MKKRFPLLDIYRILIVFVVLLFHLCIHFGYDTPFKFCNRFLYNGAVTMTGFFMLSGALLTFLYSDADLFSGNEPMAFYKKRFSKIYFLYAVVLLLFYATLYFPKPIELWLLPMQIVPLQAFFPKTFNNFINSGTWFVSDLLFVYLMFPFLNRLLKKIETHLRTAFLTVWGLIVYFSIVEAYTGQSLYVSPAVRTLEFAAGMICARTAMLRETGRLRYGMMFLLSLILTVIAAGASPRWHFFNHQLYKNHYLYTDWFLVPLSAWTIYCGLKADGDKLPEILRSKAIVYLSNLSYAFFLGQMFVTNFFFKIKAFAHYSSPTKLLLALTANLAVAVILYEVFQKRLFPRLPNLMSKKKVP